MESLHEVAMDNNDMHESGVRSEVVESARGGRPEATEMGTGCF